MASGWNDGRATPYSSTPFSATNPASSYGDPTQPGNHNLCVTLQQAFGITSDRFGDYTNVAQPVSAGPLSLS